MMGKRRAREIALQGKTSIGDLRAMITRARDLTGMSRVNPAFTIQEVLDIYEAALGDRPDDEVPAVLRPDRYRKGRMKPTGDVMLITNILRDTAE